MTSPSHRPASQSRRRVIAASAVAALGLDYPALAFAAASGGSATALPGSPVRGGVLTILQRNEAPSIVAVANGSGPTKLVSSKIIEGLLTYDFALHPQPHLATSWQASKDAKQFTFQLRPGVTWHDGRDFTSADVALSIRLISQLHPTGRVNFKSLIDVKTPSPLVAVVNFSEPNPGFLSRLSGAETPIIPRHLYEGQDYATNPVNLKPVGTGPFMFKEWVKGSHILLERNPAYWDSPKPYLDRIVVKLVLDFAAASAAFEAGAADIGYNNPVALADIDRIKALPHLAVETRGYEISGDWTSLMYNFENRYLKEVKVRQAIAHAIDRKALLSVAWYGKGRNVYAPIGPSLVEFEAPDVRRYEFDVRKAEQLLDEAGFPRQGGKDGTRFSLTIDPLPSVDSFRNSAQFLRQALARIGIQVQVRTQDFGTYLKRVYTDREFDLAYAWLITGPDPSGIQSYYWSKNFKRGIPFSNASGIQSAELDAAFEQGAIEPDRTKRAQLYKRAQHIIAEQLPSLELVAPDLYTVYNKRVHDHTVDADGLQGTLANAWVTPA